MLHVLLDLLVIELRIDEMFESKGRVCRVDNRLWFCRGSNEALLRFCKGGSGVRKGSLVRWRV